MDCIMILRWPPVPVVELRHARSNLRTLKGKRKAVLDIEDVNKTTTRLAWIFAFLSVNFCKKKDGIK